MSQTVEFPQILIGMTLSLNEKIPIGFGFPKIRIEMTLTWNEKIPIGIFSCAEIICSLLRSQKMLTK